MPWGNHLGKNWGWSGGSGGRRGRGGVNLDKKLYCGFQEEEEQGGVCVGGRGGERGAREQVENWLL